MPAEQTAAPSHADMLDHARRYFEMHAGQRMSMFNFFVVMSGAVCAGIAASVQGDRRLSVIGATLGVLLAVVSFAFWKLDQRTSFLIKHAENAIADLEAEFSRPTARLIVAERLRTQAAMAPSFPVTRLWTYGSAFRMIFLLMALVGIVSSAFLIARAAGWVGW